MAIDSALHVSWVSKVNTYHYRRTQKYIVQSSSTQRIICDITYNNVVMYIVASDTDWIHSIIKTRWNVGMSNDQWPYARKNLHSHTISYYILRNALARQQFRAVTDFAKESSTLPGLDSPRISENQYRFVGSDIAYCCKHPN